MEKVREKGGDRKGKVMVRERVKEAEKRGGVRNEIMKE